jgi:predicted enzyme related to lactoylglutathione lyase
MAHGFGGFASRLDLIPRRISMSSDSHHGRFCWYDLLTSDPKAATEFYTKVIGWDTEEWKGGTAPYTMWKASQGPIGGVTAMPEEVRQAGAPPHWLA